MAVLDRPSSGLGRGRRRRRAARSTVVDSRRCSRYRHDWRTAGIEASEAVRWHEFGYGLDAARTEKARGSGPDEAFARTHPQRSVGPTAGS